MLCLLSLVFVVIRQQPFEVFVRQKDKPINVFLISKELHNNLKTIKEVRKISSIKVLVVLACFEEANSVVLNFPHQNSRVVNSPKISHIEAN